jgi:hypothetical protein
MMSRDAFFDSAESSNEDIQTLRPLTDVKRNDIPGYLEGIPAANWQPRKRKKDLRERKKSRFLQIIERNKVRIEKVAKDLYVPEYEIIRYLLDYGLSQIRSGSLVIEPQLAQTGLTLYPDEPVGRRRRRSQALINTSCRGIPDPTWQTIKAIAVDVPLWQVLNCLLEHGLEQIENGELKPQPAQINAYTLYP